MTATRMLPARIRSANRLSRFAPLLDCLAAPLGYAGGDTNLRRYVGNLPTNMIDPSGLQAAEEKKEKQEEKQGEKQDEKPWLVIVSGFGKFPNGYNKDEDNPSNSLSQAVEKKLKNKKMACESITPIAVNWGEFEKVLASEAAKHKGARIIWIAFGAGEGFTIERRGDNDRRAIKDASGAVPGEDHVPTLNDPSEDAEGSESIQLTSEQVRAVVRAINKAVKNAKVKIKGSPEAGNYICESAVYALHKADRTGQIEVGIFIHTPRTPTAEEQEEFAEALVGALFQEGQPTPGLLIPAPKKTKPTPAPDAK